MENQKQKIRGENGLECEVILDADDQNRAFAAMRKCAAENAIRAYRWSNTKQEYVPASITPAFEYRVKWTNPTAPRDVRMYNLANQCEYTLSELKEMASSDRQVRRVLPNLDFDDRWDQ